MNKKVLIVGAGASGLMAGLWASESGADVCIIERNDRIGRKLLATGNGRCNFTNINTTIENFHGENPKFPYSAFSQFDVYQVMHFFETIGITPRVEDGGKVFPASLQSSTMIDIFNYEIRKRNIDLKLDRKVTKIYKDDVFTVETHKGETFKADSVIIATGGKALPTSGSDGNGYGLAESFGHEITETFPGIVQLHLTDKYLKEKSGVRIDGTAELYIDDKFILSDSGDVLFTDYGISGPTILQLSRRAIAGLRQGKKIQIKVKIINDRTEDELYDYLIRRYETMGEKTVSESLIGLINDKLIRSVVRDSNIRSDKLVAELSNEEINRLSKILTSWTFDVNNHQTWEFAQVTAGGIDTNNIDNRTMESKNIKGLYFTGEVLDVDGDCGGYNLQWAWSSGYVAGINAAE